MYPIVALTNKKQIKRFYKSQHYAASFIGFDKSYQVLDDEKIIASAIISYQVEENQQALLHALVVDKAYQHMGIATQLISYICKLHSNIVCFCSPELTKLYQQCNFNLCSEANLCEINKFRFSLYKNQKSLISLRYFSRNS